MRSGVPRRPFAAIAAILALLAALVVTANPAAAASSCATVTDPGPDQGSIVVFVDEDDPSATTLIEMRGTAVFVNGTSCGTPDGSVTIIDLEGDEPKVDNVRIDLASGPFRSPTAALNVNIFMDGGGADGNDQIEIRGTGSRDIMQLLPAFTQVLREDPTFPGTDPNRLIGIFFGGGFEDNVDFEFKMRGGRDLFQLLPDGGQYFGGGVVAHGDGGRDEFQGGPGTQVFNGGKGADTLNGNRGPDILNGNGGADTINGGSGGDEITGGNGADTIRAGKGRDVIDSGPKADDVAGGGGRDTCECDGNDTVTSVETLF